MRFKQEKTGAENRPREGFALDERFIVGGLSTDAAVPVVLAPQALPRDG